MASGLVRCSVSDGGLGRTSCRDAVRAARGQGVPKVSMAGHLLEMELLCARGSRADSQMSLRLWSVDRLDRYMVEVLYLSR